MESVETTGATVNDAIDAALDQLDLDEDQVAITILAEPSDDQPASVRVTPKTADAAVDPVAAAPEDSAAPVEPETWDEPLATAGREILEDLLDYMGFPGEVDVLRATRDGGTPTVAMAVVEGDSMGALIGRRGETLQALQFICQLLVNRRVGHWTRVLLDVEGYRSRRERYLKDAALRAAERAMRYHEPVELDPMVPSERRIVHMTLAQHENVSTHSEGEGDGRRVIVEPKEAYLRESGGPVRTGRGGGFGRGDRPSVGGRGRPGGGGGARRYV